MLVLESGVGVGKDGYRDGCCRLMDSLVSSSSSEGHIVKG